MLLLDLFTKRNVKISDQLDKSENVNGANQWRMTSVKTDINSNHNNIYSTSFS